MNVVFSYIKNLDIFESNNTSFWKKSLHWNKLNIIRQVGGVCYFIFLQFQLKCVFLCVCTSAVLQQRKVGLLTASWCIPLLLLLLPLSPQRHDKHPYRWGQVKLCSRGLNKWEFSYINGCFMFPTVHVHVHYKPDSRHIVALYRLTLCFSSK